MKLWNEVVGIEDFFKKKNLHCSYFLANRHLLYNNWVYIFNSIPFENTLFALGGNRGSHFENKNIQPN